MTGSQRATGDVNSATRNVKVPFRSLIPCTGALFFGVGIGMFFLAAHFDAETNEAMPGDLIRVMAVTFTAFGGYALSRVPSMFAKAPVHHAPDDLIEDLPPNPIFDNDVDMRIGADQRVEGSRVAPDESRRQRAKRNGLIFLAVLAVALPIVLVQWAPLREQVGPERSAVSHIFLALIVVAFLGLIGALGFVQSTMHRGLTLEFDRDEWRLVHSNGEPLDTGPRRQLIALQLASAYEVSYRTEGVGSSRVTSREIERGLELNLVWRDDDGELGRRSFVRVSGDARAMARLSNDLADTLDLPLIDHSQRLFQPRRAARGSRRR